MIILTTALLCGGLSLRVGTAAGAPHSAKQQEAAGLSTAEALLEDLSFRNLELLDRAMLSRRAGAPSSAKGSTMAWTFDPPGSRPSFTSAAPAGTHAKGGLAPARDLSSYVGLLSRYTPGGVVCGRFHDWRTTSVYRSNAGLHNGYDIAFPAGTTIEAGWGGQVVSIANWYGAEYGITVQSPEGFRTTYGHLSPLTHVGAWVNPGDAVGRVVHDHVDVKMRDWAGSFIDFAQGVPGLGNGGTYVARGGASSAPSFGGGGVSLTFHIHTQPTVASRQLPPLVGPAWTRREEAVRAAIAYLRVRYQEAHLLEQGAAPPSALTAIRQQVEDARGRLVVNGVPEDVLLAAFADSNVLRQGEMSHGELSSDKVDGFDEDAMRREEMIRTASQALPQLNALLRDLNAQAPAPRRS